MQQLGNIKTRGEFQIFLNYNENVLIERIERSSALANLKLAKARASA